MLAANLYITFCIMCIPFFELHAAASLVQILFCDQKSYPDFNVQSCTVALP